MADQIKTPEGVRRDLSNLLNEIRGANGGQDERLTVGEHPETHALSLQISNGSRGATVDISIYGRVLLDQFEESMRECAEMARREERGVQIPEQESNALVRRMESRARRINTLHNLLPRLGDDQRNHQEILDFRRDYSQTIERLRRLQRELNRPPRPQQQPQNRRRLEVGAMETPTGDMLGGIIPTPLREPLAPQAAAVALT